MSKNKLKSELQNLKQDNLINYISLQGGKGKRNENYIQGPSHSNVRTANHLQEAEFRNQVDNFSCSTFCSLCIFRGFIVIL
jgi:hypothetical protein